jgi:mRNA-degrading endonuclease toxin of MazEF toxin-antitoxin module
MKEGEIYLAEFRDPKGREIKKDRGVVIIKNFVGYGVIFAVPISTGEQRFAEAFNVPLIKTPTNGLEEDSVAVTYQGTTLDKKERLIKKLGELDSESFELIKVNLRKQLGL